MENYRNSNVDQFEYTKTVSDKSLMVYTFGWMFLALAISSVLSVAFHFIPALDGLLFADAGNGIVKPTIFAYVAVFSPLAISLAISFGFEKMSFGVLAALFVLYACLIGVSFSTLFYVYQMGSIITIFVSTAGLFGLMAVIGATTKTDLTKMGSYLMMAFLGLIIASLINWFAHSSTLDYLISFAGVAIFTGLAAYHTQKLKELSAQSDGSVTFKKLGLMSAFSLYVTFINLFMFLLRLFGRRD
jgi:FtsH-binding integral membrane protein